MPYVPFRNVRIRYPAVPDTSTKYSPMAERTGDHVGVEECKSFTPPNVPTTSASTTRLPLGSLDFNPEYPTPVQLLLQGEGSQSHKGWRIWLKKGQGTHRKQKDSACMMLIYCVHGAFQRLGGRGYDDFVPGEVTETTPSGDRTT